jgi:phosphate transport system protein
MRNDLELQTEQLRTNVAAMGDRADAMLQHALRGFSDNDLAAAETTVAADDEVDRTYEQIQHGVLAVVALHGPVGHDLRLLTGLIHVSLHLERMADYAVNTARAAIAVAGFPSSGDLTARCTHYEFDPRAISQSMRRRDDRRPGLRVRPGRFSSRAGEPRVGPAASPGRRCPEPV